MALWNPDEQYDLDPATNQYAQQQQQQPQAAGIDWGSVEQQLRDKGGNLYDPSDLEGIKRNTGYNVGGSTLDQALQNQFNIYGQRASSTGGGGGGQSPQYATPTQQWNQQPAASPQSDALYAQLMQRAQQGTAVNRNDPNIRQQVDPVVAQQERASRNYLDDVAERSGPLANMQGERRLAAERSGQAAGAFESEVIGREMAAKRDEIQQALSLYGSMLSQDKQLALQNQLAQLNAAIQREGFGVQREGLANQRYGMDQSNDQFMRELALREWMAGDQSDRGWAGFGG